MFDDLVEEELGKGLFSTKKNRAKEIEEHHYYWPDWMKKKLHSEDGSYNIKDEPGRISHIGDVPYTERSAMMHGCLNSPAVQRQYKDRERILRRSMPDYKDSMNGARNWRTQLPQITQKDINRKSSSVRHAIARYMPRKTFEKFLNAVLDDTHETSYPYALKECFETYGNQFKVLIDLNDNHRPEYAEQVEDILEHPENYPKDTLRYALVRCKDRFLMKKETDLAMTLIIYQAMHVAYLQEFENAVLRNRNMTKEEQKNALSVLHGAFMEFHQFATFAVVAPLILLERKRIVAEEFDRLSASGDLEQEIEIAKVEQKVNSSMGRYHPDAFKDKTHLALFEAKENEFNQKAIEAAWNTILTKDVLKTHHSSGASQLCPASTHLRESSAGKDMLRIYDAVTQDMHHFYQVQKEGSVTGPSHLLGYCWFDVDKQTAKAVEEAQHWHPSFKKAVRAYVKDLVEKSIWVDDYRWKLCGDMGYEIDPADYKYYPSSHTDKHARCLHATVGRSR